MSITDVPHRAAPDTPVSRPRAAVSDTAPATSRPANTGSQVPKRKTIKPGRDGLMTGLRLAAAIGATLVGAIGFAMSYSTLAEVALSWGFSPSLAQWFPIGVDASILAFLALDLYLIRKDIPWPVLRMAAHAMTALTIWFNASSQGHIAADPVQAASHGVMPVLFVIGVEAARKLFIKKTQLETGKYADRIPLHRWILDPIGTPRLYRRMRLYGITSYPEMIRRDQDLIAYEQWLKRKYGRKLAGATDDELLPMTMAKYGYTVAEALAMPDQQEREAEKRAEEAENRKRDAETRRRIAETQSEAELLEADGDLDAVRFSVEARKSAARRAAELEKEAEESALVAEARAREAEAERRAADERKAKAAADAEAAELERVAAQKRKEAAEADKVAAAEAQAIETQTIAEAREAAAEADQRAAETEAAASETRLAAAEADAKAAEEKAREEAAIAAAEQSKLDAAEMAKAAAEARAAAAEIEVRAVEIEDAARMTPRQRAVRKVARMILNAGGDSRQVPLADIEDALGVVTGTASEYRAEAAELLAAGGDPTQ